MSDRDIVILGLVIRAVLIGIAFYWTLKVGVPFLRDLQHHVKECG